MAVQDILFQLQRSPIFWPFKGSVKVVRTRQTESSTQLYYLVTKQEHIKSTFVRNIVLTALKTAYLIDPGLYSIL